MLKRPKPPFWQVTHHATMILNGFWLWHSEKFRMEYHDVSCIYIESLRSKLLDRLALMFGWKGGTCLSIGSAGPPFCLRDLKVPCYLDSRGLDASSRYRPHWRGRLAGHPRHRGDPPISVDRFHQSSGGSWNEHSVRGGVASLHCVAGLLSGHLSWWVHVQPHQCHASGAGLASLPESHLCQKRRRRSRFHWRRAVERSEHHSAKPSCSTRWGYQSDRGKRACP